LEVNLEKETEKEKGVGITIETKCECEEKINIEVDADWSRTCRVDLIRPHYPDTSHANYSTQFRCRNCNLMRKKP